MRAPIVAIALLAGCGNSTGDTDPAAVGSCAYQTTLLPELDATAWPAGLADALPAYHSLDGVFYLEDCVDDSVADHEIKITTVPQEEILVITGGVSPEVACGCTLDPSYTHDNTMDPVGLLPPVELYIPPTLEPSGVGRTYMMEGALFGAGQDLLLRACAHRTIDPAEESDYDDVYIFLRANAAGELDMTLMLNTIGSNAAPSECHFTELRPQ